jgi:hypothetical protein
MKNIHIVSPESFMQYGNQFGIVLFDKPNQKTVNLFTGDKHLVVKRDELNFVSYQVIEKELIDNPELKELAHENNLIELHNQDVEGYLTYASSYC